MTDVKQQHPEATVEVENIGGIDRSSVTFSPGVTLLVGRNATNRTSFLQAVMAAIGCDPVSMKSDAETASVDLRLGDRTYSRQLTRGEGGLSTNGEPYLASAELAELFACLLETNEARKAIATGGKLRELIMRPIDTEAIEARIEDLLAERQRVSERIASIEAEREELPALEERERELAGEIDETRELLSDREAELAALEFDLEESREERSELQAALAALGEHRAELETLRYDTETERERLEALRAERAACREEREDLTTVAHEGPAGLEAEIERLQHEKGQIEAAVSELQHVIGFNEEMLTDPRSPALADLGDDDRPVTDGLAAGERISCWTCGGEVETEQVERTLERLRELSQQHLARLTELEESLGEARERAAARRKANERQTELDERLAQIDREIEDAEASIDTLAARREEVSEAIAATETEIEALETDSHERVLELHSESNELEYELGRLENERAGVTDRRATLEDRLATLPEERAERDRLVEAIENQRTRIADIEREATTGFNEEIATVLELLEYDNIDRVWLEAVDGGGQAGVTADTERAFDLHVIRRSAGGVSYEDRIEHLSESEREVVGLIFALAGYLAYDVAEQLPFILLDSLEAIDADRIATLVTYLAERTGYLLVALLPEDAAALPQTYQRIEDI